MIYIKEAFKYIQYFADEFSIEYDNENRYYTSIVGIRKYLKNNTIVLDNNMRRAIEQYLHDLGIANIKQNIYIIVHPNSEISEYTDLSGCDVDILSDTQLVDYLMLVFSTITFNQNGNLVLLKYGIAIWVTGFHNLAKKCRGKIIDTDTMTIVSYPFDKFFNVNEVPETKENIIQDYVKKANYIFATDKKDGSTVIVSKYKGKPLITTNGSFDNNQIAMAKELFDKQYPTFLKNIKEGYTYIFELIHPNNKIVIDYGEEKALYMLSIRDVNAGCLLSIDAIHDVADKYGFPYPDIYDFQNLETMIHLAHTMKNANKEGWVIRIGCNDGEIMVKLKLDEYFAMHKVFGVIRLGWVYKHLVNKDLDDFLAICNDEQKTKIYAKIDIITSVKEKIKNDVEHGASAYLQKYNIAADEFSKDRQRMVSIIKDILTSNDEYKMFIVKYLKNKTSLDKTLDCINYATMKKIFARYGENVNE